jgi:valyl-tRNA synthetase
MPARTEGELVVLGADLEAHISTGVASMAPDRIRLERELAEAQAALERAEARLADGGFTARAPADVVAGTRTRAAELRERIELLRARMA